MAERDLGFMGTELSAPIVFEALHEILSLMVGDARRRAAWVQNQLKNQGRFLKSYFDSTGESALLGAEALDKFLTKNRPEQQVEG